MKNKRREHTIIGYFVLGVALILFIIYFSKICSFFGILWNACSSLVFGAMLAFVLNIIMDPIQKHLSKRKNKFVAKHAKSLALTLTMVIAIGIISLLTSLVIPNLIDSIRIFVQTVPQYTNEIKVFLEKVFKDYPTIVTKIEATNFNWAEVFSGVSQFTSKGFSNVMDSTISLVTAIVNSTVNLLMIVIFAIYVLSEKQRFIRLYHFLTNLYLNAQDKSRLNLILRTTNQTFKAFIGGECIEACILTTMCFVGMLILRMPYALMISILVGVINMIPMVGAFIGGGIGMLLIFTVSPVKAVVFLIFLCVIQQIESNVFFPRVVGHNVGLPGIYVMMVIVVGGSLAGVFGMVLGVPAAATVYKLLKIFFEKQAQKKAALQKETVQVQKQTE